MRTSPPSLFTKSLLAAAVIAATGCASTAPERTDDAGFSGPLVTAGRATASLTARAVYRTGYLLGLHDNDKPTGDSPPMDDVDRAMLEEDAVMPTGEQPVTMAGIERIDAQPQPRGLFDEGSRLPLAETGEAETGEDPLAVARFVAADDATSDELPIGASLSGDPIDSTTTAVVASNDFTHTVDADETLWDIAKATTGDATNWHALADVNDLGQNASVYPGQDLIIPADMLRPELADAAIDATTDAPSDEMLATGAVAQVPLADPLLDVVTGPAASPRTSDQPTSVAAASPVAPAAERPSDDARGFIVEAGESLWEFARRTTGDATEWQRIAAHNGFDEQRARTIRQGEQIFVPDTLVRAELGVATAPSGEQGSVQSDIAPITERVSPRMVPIAEASAALPAEPALAATDTPTAAETALETAADTTLPDGTSGLDETQDMTIVEASYREPDIESLAAPSADVPTEIMISGTYYPKAIYNEADFSSSLLMRVSPGTRLRVARVDGAWYEVETEDGVGYVHDRDIK